MGARPRWEGLEAPRPWEVDGGAPAAEGLGALRSGRKGTLVVVSGEGVGGVRRWMEERGSGGGVGFLVLLSGHRIDPTDPVKKHTPTAPLPTTHDLSLSPASTFLLLPVPTPPHLHTIFKIRPPPDPLLPPSSARRKLAVATPPPAHLPDRSAYPRRHLPSHGGFPRGAPPPRSPALPRAPPSAAGPSSCQDGSAPVPDQLPAPPLPRDGSAAPCSPSPPVVSARRLAELSRMAASRRAPTAFLTGRSSAAVSRLGGAGFRLGAACLASPSTLFYAVRQSSGHRLGHPPTTRPWTMAVCSSRRALDVRFGMLFVLRRKLMYNTRWHCKFLCGFVCIVGGQMGCGCPRVCGEASGCVVDGDGEADAADAEATSCLEDCRRFVYSSTKKAGSAAIGLHVEENISFKKGTWFRFAHFHLMVQMEM